MDLNPDHIGLNGSPTKVVTSFGKMAKGAGELSWTLTPDEAVAAIIAKMEERAHHLRKGGAKLTMSKDLYVVAEQRDGEIAKVTLELLGEATKLAADLGEKVVWSSDGRPESRARLRP